MTLAGIDLTMSEVKMIDVIIKISFEGGGYYGFEFPGSLPWRFSRDPFEFVIFKFLE